MAENVHAGDFFQDHIEIELCPHCSTVRPSMRMPMARTVGASQFISNDYAEKRFAAWATFVCSVCGGAVLARIGLRKDIREGLQAGSSLKTYPTSRTVNEDIPERPRNYLSQALRSLAQPDGAVMLAASAVDAMLKEHGLKDGSLYTRIQKARESGLITPGMAEWAHEVRLGANEQRHADEEHSPNTPAEAERLVEFAAALADLLFVLPARISRGRKRATEGKT